MAPPAQSRSFRSRRAASLRSDGRTVILMSLFGALLGCASPEPSVATEDVGGMVLASTPVAPGAARSLEFAIGTCAAAECPLEIRLVGAGGAIDVERLEWSVSTDAAQQGPVGPTAGVGDPLAREVTAWTTGEDERMATAAGRAVRLSRDRTGMLIDLSAGFEHPKRRHELWIGESDSLRRVWLGTELQGPAWSTVSVTLAPDGTSDTMVYFDGYAAAQDGDPDVLRPVRLVWREDRGMIEAVPAGSGVHAILVGSYQSVEQARDARDQAPDCLASYWVLPASELGVTDRGPVMLAALTASDSLANAELERVSLCSGSAAASRVQISGGD